MIEHRAATGSAEATGDTLTGLVTPFGVETMIGDPKRDGFREKVMPGAFKKTLQERDVVLVHSHAPHMPLARTSITQGPGSLTLREDPNAGLRMEAEPVKTSYGQDVLDLTKAGVIRGMSFGFEVIKDSWTDDEGRAANAMTGTRRSIHEVRLHEVTTTAFPAYPTTSLTAARDAISAARGATETRADANQGQDIASVDAALDEALRLLCSADRDSLPPEVNQAIDLLHSASKGIDGVMQDSGIPDPDESSNTNEYDGAGSATPDEGERADSALLAMHYRITEEN